uniref:RING-type domain-containing protein n=1 Tax=Romanomermis culicivorax TaxID=13658 RepID=A0A915KV06_ROMCU
MEPQEWLKTVTSKSLPKDKSLMSKGIETSSRNDATDSSTIVTTVNNENLTTPTENSIAHDPSGSGAVVDRRGNESNREWRNLTELSRTVNSQRIIKYACFFVPFLLILLFRAVFVYTKDIFTITTLFTVFIYADGFITSQATTKSNACRMKVFGLSIGLLFLLAITYVILYGNDETARLLIFSLPQTFLIEEGKNLRLSTILWYVLITDLAAKLITMIIKCQIILLPADVISYKRRVLFALNKLQSWWSCLKVCFRPRSIGQKPDSVDLHNCGPQCSICYCPFENPVQLECKHIYCEDCISTWLDKEKTCPICRARVDVENRSWRDGSTSMTNHLTHDTVNVS